MKKYVVSAVYCKDFPGNKRQMSLRMAQEDASSKEEAIGKFISENSCDDQYILIMPVVLVV